MTKKRTTSSQRKPRTAPSPSRSGTPLDVQLIALSSIDPSPLNRVVKDEDELVPSIKAHGVQQAVKLRPKGDRYEVVYGERRVRAALKAGLAEIPATVEELSDDEAHELRVLENASRKDPHPMEEAEAWERLLAARDAKGRAVHTPESIATLIGRSVQHVYGRLRLTALVPALRTALFQGKLSTSAAFRVARSVPPELQEEAWRKICAYVEGEAYEEQFNEHGQLTAAAVQAIIDRDYTFRLDRASFPLADASLVPAAGPCTTCARRNQNQPQLFHSSEDQEVDSCLDVACFRRKESAFFEARKAEVLAAGGRILSSDENKKVFTWGKQLPYSSPWLDLDAPCFDDAERRSWREILGDLCPAPTLGTTSQGVAVQLAPKELVLTTLEQNGIQLRRIPASPQREPGEDDDAPGDDRLQGSSVDSAGPESDRSPYSAATDHEAQRFRAEVTRVSRQRLLAAIVAGAEAAGPGDPRALKLAIQSFLHGGFHNALIETAKRRIEKIPRGEQASTTVAGLVAGMDAPQLAGLLLELCISRVAYYVAGGRDLPRDLQAAIEAYGVDALAIARAVEAELEAKRQARALKKAS